MMSIYYKNTMNPIVFEVRHFMLLNMQIVTFVVVLISGRHS